MQLIQNANPAIRIIIAEPCAVLRTGIRLLLKDEVDLEVIAEAANSVEAIERTRQQKPDILLLDIAWWNFSGMDTLHTLSVLRKEVKTILLAVPLDEKQSQAAIALGVRSVIGKESSPDLLIKCLRAVASGEYWFDRATPVTSLETARAVAPVLTPREMEIVAELLAGSSNARIAAKLNVTEATVQRQRAKIYERLGVSNWTQLAMFAVGHRIEVRDQRRSRDKDIDFPGLV